MTTPAPRQLPACPDKPNCVSSQDADEGHRIAPLSCSGDADASFARLLQLLRQRRDATIIEVEDDGLGISDERLKTAMSSGIGLSNVDERLRVIYGATARLALRGAPGRGATAHLEIPILVAQEQATA